MVIMSIRTLLTDEIKEELKELSDMEVGSDEYQKTVDGVAKLFDRAIEFEKLDVEREEKAKDREIDYDFKLKQIDEERKDRWVKNGLTAFSIVTGLGLTVWGTLATFKFEESGTVTTIVGRGFINKLLPKK
jgi:hypothetical protein